MTLITTAGYRQLAATEASSKPIARINGLHVASLQVGSCTTCSGNAVRFDDMLSLREWAISGMCQLCQNATFGGDEPENDGPAGDFLADYWSTVGGPDEPVEYSQYDV